MTASTIYTWLGTIFISIAVVLHITCLVSDYHVKASLDKEFMDDMVKKMGVLPAQFEQFNSVMKDQSLHYGLWQLCYSVDLYGMKTHSCIEWGGKLTLLEWIKAAQAMGILGTLIMATGVILGIVHLGQKSQGDRLKLFPYIICAAAVLGGIITFIGDIIMAANYKDLINDMPFAPFMPKETMEVIDSIMNQFGLGWCFAVDIVAVFVAFFGGGLHVLARHKSGGSGMV